MISRRTRSPRGSGEQLRAEIIAAAKELMTQAATPEDVSIRAVADAVGVTAPSIYRHFEDKNDLLSAVVVDVFADLDRAMVTAAESATGPAERLLAFGKAYVAFALEHPDHYRLATMDSCPRPDVDAVLAEGAWVHFHSVVEECLEAGVFPEGDSTEITLSLWAAGHGIASLMIVKDDFPWGDKMAMAERVLLASAYGHTVPPGTRLGGAVGGRSPRLTGDS